MHIMFMPWRISHENVFYRACVLRRDDIARGIVSNVSIPIARMSHVCRELVWKKKISILRDTYMCVANRMRIRKGASARGGMRTRKRAQFSVLLTRFVHAARYIAVVAAAAFSQLRKTYAQGSPRGHDEFIRKKGIKRAAPYKFPGSFSPVVFSLTLKRFIAGAKAT